MATNAILYCGLTPSAYRGKQEDQLWSYHCRLKGSDYSKELLWWPC